ncbi:metal-dependent hydrolase [Bacillus nakamurai]|uniref:bacillithiol transferase BstA n=1 Tax=Bacillus nakamurai TaxID=1793963 RepID=UPI00077837EF|nr:bacillithiol transferase BstA [Bacillus nakamurai]KXZ23536.1 metal-dependent hydrolase [Bacillus nakamurai]
MKTENLKFPIGEYKPAEFISAEQRQEWINTLEHAPAKLEHAVIAMSDSQLDTPYRDGGWTVRQVVHHMADSHMNGYIRFKLSLTEEEPAIRPYDEKCWADLHDSKTADCGASIELLTILHKRWADLLRSMTDAQFKRTFFHPATKETTTLENALGLYVWHSEHHIAHITELSRRMGWHLS